MSRFVDYFSCQIWRNNCVDIYLKGKHYGKVYGDREYVL